MADRKSPLSGEPGTSKAAGGSWGNRTADSVRPMYRLWVNEDHTVAIRLWEDDTLEVMTRESSDYDWGKATVLREEKVT